MAEGKRKALIVCPGRGTYSKSELGYLARHAGRHAAFLDFADNYRATRGLPTLRALDGAESFSASVHTRGDNASPLIFACSFTDFLAIDRERFDVVAVTGNSMGWYTALACAGALSPEDGLAVVNAMGVYMHEAAIGGQAIYALVDEDWRPIPGRREALIGLIAELHAPPERSLYVSIELGGMLVVAGDAGGLAAFQARAPAGPGRFPIALQNHAAFHTPLQAPVSEEARSSLASDMFNRPKLPLIDGRGGIWRRHADPAALWDYTLGHQVVAPYDFTAAIRVGVREFAPDCLIVLGPGETLGGAVAQCLIAAQWRGLDGKPAFVAAQADEPLVLSMGRDDQRSWVAGVGFPT
jgi:[acyl-carrier-protein] S-malonyltransferase